MSTLCGRCGLCCDGSLFSRVELDDADLDRLNDRAIEVRREHGLRMLPQPCAAYTGCSCAVYESRPRRCATYTCRTLADFTDGRLTLEQAISRVSRLRRAADTIRAALPPETASEALFDAASRFFDGEDGVAWRRDNGAVLLEMAVFLRSCRRDIAAETDTDPLRT